MRQPRIFLVLLASSSLAAVCPSSNKTTPPKGATGTAPAISTQPQAQTVAVGATATFTVTASGTAPLAYQWRENGGVILGATSASFTTAAAVASDDGAAFSVVVSNATGSVTSADAVLSVTAPGGPGGGAPGTLTYHHRGVDGGDGAPFLAFEDGTGPWQTVTHTASGDYAFTVNDARGRYGIAAGDGALFGAPSYGSGLVFYGTLKEISELTLPFAGAPVAQVQSQAIVSNVPDGDLVQVALGRHGWVNFTATPAGGGAVTSNVLGIPAGDYDALLTLIGGNPTGPLTYAYFAGFSIAGSGQNEVDLDATVTEASSDHTLSVTNLAANAHVNLNGWAALADETPDPAFDHLSVNAIADAGGSASGTINFPSFVPLKVLSANTISAGAAPSALVYLWSSTSDGNSLAMPAPLWLTDVAYVSTTIRTQFTWTPTSGTPVYAYQLTGKQKGNASAELVWNGVITAGWAGSGASAVIAWPDFAPGSDWAATADTLDLADGALTWTFSGYDFNADLQSTVLAVVDAPNTQPPRKTGDLLVQQIGYSSGNKTLCGSAGCGTR